MDGKRIQRFWSDEVDALIRTYLQFEKLIPAEGRDGSAHKGEDGRYVEDLLREYLEKFLPNRLEVLTGFILRPAVKTGKNGRERYGEQDRHSTQLDIIVYDSINYPIFQRFGKSVIVPPEGVIAVISVKKHLNCNDIKKECSALFEVAGLCQTLGTNKQSDKARGPFLALVSVKSRIKKRRTNTLNWVFSQLKKSYESHKEITFDRLVGYIGALDEWSLFKARPDRKLKNARYVGFTHRDDESHLGLQFLLSGVLSVFYDETRRAQRRPGFTAFPSGRLHDRELGVIPYKRLR